MTNTAVMKDQFNITANELKHRPTGATFSIKDGTKEFAWIHWGLAGAILPNCKDTIATKSV